MEQSELSSIFLFRALHRAHRNAVQAQLNAQGLQDVGQPMIFFILEHRSRTGKPMNQRDLSNALHVSPATVAASLKSLVRMGYVDRKEDAEDSRCKLISVTEKGAAALEKCHRVFSSVDRRMMAGFTEEEILQLDGYHQKMLENLRTIGGAEQEGRVE